MKAERDGRAVFHAMGSSLRYLAVVLLGAGLLALYGCAGTAGSVVSADGGDNWYQVADPDDPTLSDEALCEAAGKLAKEMDYSAPLCLYMGPGRKIMARKGGMATVKDDPAGKASVMMMVNTGGAPVQIMNWKLKTGEVALWKSVGKKVDLERLDVNLTPEEEKP